jgi:translation initiation factor IF-1
MSRREQYHNTGGLYMNGLKLTLSVFAMTAQLTANAQTNLQPEQPRVFLARTNELKATVLGVDYKNREVILQSTNGNLNRFAVSDRIQNFEKIRQGDEVNIKYYESVAYAVVKPGEELSATSRSEAVATQPEGKSPGGAAMSISNTTATIQAIDRDNRQVVLKSANGDIVHVFVDPAVGNLRRIKEGDQVSVTMTKAIAVSVEKPGDSFDKTNSAPE